MDPGYSGGCFCEFKVKVNFSPLLQPLASHCKQQIYGLKEREVIPLVMIHQTIFGINMTDFSTLLVGYFMIQLELQTVRSSSNFR